jgi:hypothetical protein
MKITEALYMAILISIVGRVIDKSPLAGYIESQCVSVATWYDRNSLAKCIVSNCAVFVGAVQTNAFNAVATFFDGLNKDIGNCFKSCDQNQNQNQNQNQKQNHKY